MNYYRFFYGKYRAAAKRMCKDCEGFIGKKSRILDLGCGSGIVGEQFRDFFRADLVGADVEDLRVAKIPFRIIDGVNLPFSENSFDTILINYVLHHAHDPLALLKEAKRVARGKIIIYEDLPEGFLSKLICSLHGITFNQFFQKKNRKFGFKNDGEWNEAFESLGLKKIFEKKVSSIFHPVKKKLFVVQKTGA